MEVSGQLHAPATLYPREMTPIPIVQEAGWASELVWTQRLGKNPMSVPGIEFRSSIVQSDTILTELPQPSKGSRRLNTKVSQWTRS
jgi:hypothetical protein